MPDNSHPSAQPRRIVYFLSNRTAITAETLGHSLLAQFPDIDFSTTTIPFIDSEDKAQRIVDAINREHADSGIRPIVISTMADEAISSIILKSKALVLDPFDQFLPGLENLLQTTSIHASGQSHRIANQTLYESRIDAIDYSMIHDDGVTTKNYDQAEIIVVGVSRVGKTPTCLYLALQFGLKAANYPITEEDMESEGLPKIVRQYKRKIFGLTTNPKRLAHIRQERRPNSRYASLEQCRYEIKTAEEMFYNHKVPYLNTTTMSIEEIATKIVEVTGLHRISRPQISKMDF
ncbi:MAG: pyruvate, water dikinase regulatory protein [Gammaproteobacteria bacterium]|nr:pyruvate, water dikinase regulatory protein [Gammaproteobacteria bacterium]